MKHRLLALFLAALALILPSCVGVDPYPYSGGYSSYHGPSHYDPGYGYGSGYYSRPSYYGSSYSVCSVCRRNPCSCRHSSHDHSSHRSSSSGSSRSDHLNNHGKLKLVGGSDGDHSNRPQGTHNKEWYQKRGYDLKDYKVKDEDGHVVKPKRK